MIITQLYPFCLSHEKVTTPSTPFEWVFLFKAPYDVICAEAVANACNVVNSAEWHALMELHKQKELTKNNMRT